MLFVVGASISVLLLSAESVSQPTFVEHWSHSDYEAACLALDQQKTAPTLSNELLIAARARKRCAATALAAGQLDNAAGQIEELEDYGVLVAEAQVLSERLSGARGLIAARRGALPLALDYGARVRAELWPIGLNTELLRQARAAMQKRELKSAGRVLELLRSKAPETFALDDLERQLWWAQRGGVVAFRVALGAFLLLLALTARSLLRTRRRTRALLRQETLT
jgi:hypothetical protein